MTNTEEEKVRQLLCNIQLDQFYRQIQDKLHVSRLSHFDHVREDDLHDLGMAKPERRRLFEALKKAKKKNLFASFRRKVSATRTLYLELCSCSACDFWHFGVVIQLCFRKRC